MRERGNDTVRGEMKTGGNSEGETELKRGGEEMKGEGSAQRKGVKNVEK